MSNCLKHPYPLKIIRTLNHVMFDQFGFRGNDKNYYDPRNSFLNEVLTRRTGDSHHPVVGLFRTG